MQEFHLLQCSWDHYLPWPLDLQPLPTCLVCHESMQVLPGRYYHATEDEETLFDIQKRVAEEEGMFDNVFWHTCKFPHCLIRLAQDNEPYCFAHTGSNPPIPGYSAKVEAEKK